MVKDKEVILEQNCVFQKLLLGAITRINKLTKRLIEDNTNLAQGEKNVAASERKLKRQIYFVQQSQAEIIVLHKMQMTELQEKKYYTKVTETD